MKRAVPPWVSMNRPAKVRRHAKRAICAHCEAGNHFAHHSAIGCLRAMLSDYICGCTVPQTERAS
jgi:hypothetical protein